MSTYQSPTPLAQHVPANTVQTTYGDNTTGYVSEIIDVSSYDVVTVDIDFTPAGAEDQLDLEILHTGHPGTADFDPDATPPVGAYALPEDMVRSLLPSDLSLDLEFSITNVAARASGGAFKRVLTLDVLGLSKIRIAAKSDAAGGALVLGIYPNGPDRPAALQAQVR